jgi:hypothetical protein
MANLGSDNVTPLRPAKPTRTNSTAALRQRGSRPKRKRVTLAATKSRESPSGKPSRIKAGVEVS